LLGLAQATVPGVEGNRTRANRLMQDAMEYSQDGAPMTNRNFGGEADTAQSTLPDPDSVQEAEFETLNSSAQFATPATVILTTKSASNSVHGRRLSAGAGPERAARFLSSFFIGRSALTSELPPHGPQGPNPQPPSEGAGPRP